MTKANSGDPEPAGRRPPTMEKILGLTGPIVDELYDIGLLSGPKGTWHRLWGLLALEWYFADQLPDAQGVIAEVRDELETLLNRTITETEWTELNAHARFHAEKVIRPVMGTHRTGEKGQVECRASGRPK